MPKQPRYNRKQRLQTAINEMEKAKEIIAVEGAPFEGVHDDYFKVFGSIFMNLDETISATTKLKDAI